MHLPAARARLASLLQLPAAPDDPSAAVRAAEAAADARPGDPGAAEALRIAHGWATADHSLPAVVGGVRRERLLRYDDVSTTWVGVRVLDGRPAMVRALRPAFVRDPVWQRHLARAARARTWSGAIATVEDGALVVPLLGIPLGSRAIGSASPVATVARAVAALARADAAGISLPALDADEVRLQGDDVGIVCLTVDGPPSFPDNLAALSMGLSPTENDEADAVLAGFEAFPPRDAADAAEALSRLFASSLASRWHALRARRARSAHLDKAARLYEAIEALERSTPPPRGRAAVGVDLDGRVTVVSGDGVAIVWGPVGAEPAEVWSVSEGVTPREARRMLRARAAAPHNPRLQKQIDGDGAFVEAVGRWVAAALQLRTLRLLVLAQLRGAT